MGYGLNDSANKKVFLRLFFIMFLDNRVANAQFSDKRVKNANFANKRVKNA